jgi:hypothetical protein
VSALELSVVVRAGLSSVPSDDLFRDAISSREHSLKAERVADSGRSVSFRAQLPSIGIAPAIARGIPVRWSDVVSVFNVQDGALKADMRLMEIWSIAGPRLSIEVGLASKESGVQSEGKVRPRGLDLSGHEIKSAAEYVLAAAWSLRSKNEGIEVTAKLATNELGRVEIVLGRGNRPTMQKSTWAFLRKKRFLIRCGRGTEINPEQLKYAEDCYKRHWPSLDRETRLP